MPKENTCPEQDNNKEYMQAIIQWVSTSYDYLISINKQCKTIDINEVNVLSISYGKSINSSITIEMIKLTMYPTNTLLNKCFKSSSIAYHQNLLRQDGLF
jgi:hypothetical protein